MPVAATWPKSEYELSMNDMPESRDRHDPSCSYLSPHRWCFSTALAVAKCFPGQIEIVICARSLMIISSTFTLNSTFMGLLVDLDVNQGRSGGQTHWVDG